MYRRVIAAFAAGALALVAIPFASPASAADACALGATCEGTATGSLGTTTWKIQMPGKFNGTVLLYSHGYRIADPVPQAIAVRVGYDKDPNYTRVEVPGPLGAALTQGFGSNVAYQGNGTAQVAPDAAIATQLLAKGYALAGAGYASQGWAVDEGVQAGELLLDHIYDGGIKGVKKVAVYGQSLGAPISLVLAERNKKRVSGALAMCGGLSGPEQLWSGAMTLLYTWKTLLTPNLRVANYRNYGEALTDLATVSTTLAAFQADPTLVRNGYPVAQANLLAGLMAGLPTQSQTFDGFENPNVAAVPGGTAVARAQGYTPINAGAAAVAAMAQNAGSAAALGILGRWNLEQKARAAAGLGPTDNANFNGNVAVRYSDLLSESQRNEFGDTLRAVPGVPDNLQRMLDALDASRGSTDLRFQENGAAVAAVRAIKNPNGSGWATPTVLVTNQSDPITPEGNQGYMVDLMLDKKAKFEKRRGVGAMTMLYPLYTEAVPTNYTRYNPDGRAPDAAASGTQSGVGHCNFALNNYAQVIGAVDVLAAYMNKGNLAGGKKGNQVRRSVDGFINDADYQPTPLKRVALAK